MRQICSRASTEVLTSRPKIKMAASGGLLSLPLAIGMINVIVSLAGSTA